MNTTMRKLLDCRNIWAWKAITGSHDRYDYPKAMEYPFGCPCCEIAGAIITGEHHWLDVSFIDRNCNLCPLTGIAWNNEWEIDEEEEEYEEDVFTCYCVNDPDSFYRNFNQNHETIPSQYWAMRMVRACDQVIEKLILESSEDLFQ